MALDKQMRLEIAQIVNQAARDAYMIYNEQYISASELCKQFQMIKRDWLKNDANKMLLHAKRMRYKDKAGNIKEGNFAYPKHKIAIMVENGELDFTENCEYRPSRT